MQEKMVVWVLMEKLRMVLIQMIFPGHLYQERRLHQRRQLFKQNLKSVQRQAQSEICTFIGQANAVTFFPTYQKLLFAQCIRKKHSSVWEKCREGGVCCCFLIVSSSLILSQIAYPSLGGVNWIHIPVKVVHGPCVVIVAYMGVSITRDLPVFVNSAYQDLSLRVLNVLAPNCCNFSLFLNCPPWGLTFWATGTMLGEEVLKVLGDREGGV